MKLNKSAQKISFIFIMLILALTLFNVPKYTFVKAEETTETETEETILSDNNYLSSLTSSNGTMTPAFDASVNNYELVIDKYDSNFTLTAEVADETATIEGLGKYYLEVGETKNVDVIVTSESGVINIYTIAATRETLSDEENSSKLSKLEIDGYDLDFHSLTTEYNLEILASEIDLNITTKTYDNNATVKIENNRYLKNDTGTITILVTEPNSESTTYTINYTKISIDSIYNFTYTGNEQNFKVPYNGYYSVELWGASGGRNLSSNGYTESTVKIPGLGAYTKGQIYLEKNTELFVYVGGVGSDALKQTIVPGGYNGGGDGDHDHDDDEASGAGGGATDIRLVNGLWDNFESLKSRIMVAGAGGGASYNANGGNAGTLEGENTTYSTGGTQTSGYAFGIGQDGVYVNTNVDVAGGGSGYYGGYSNSSGATNTYLASGAGGSSFVSGCDKCNAIAEESTIDNIIHTNQPVHYSGYEFTNITMLSGSEEMPTTDGTSTMTGNLGDGYAKITPLMLSEDNYLESLTTSSGTLTPSFDPLVTEYTLIVDEYTSYFSVDGVLSDENANATGLKQYSLNNGESKTIKILVMSESGDTKIYSIYATREEISEASNTSLLKTLKIGKYENALSPRFTSLLTEYDLQINANETALTIETAAYNSNATITVTGNDTLSDTGVITIEVAVEGLESTVYTINYTKVQYIDVTADSILDFANNYDLPNGNYNVTIEGKNDAGEIETKTYLVELINYYDDVTYTLEDADENGKVILGDTTTEYKMLIAKYHGDLTIEDGVTLTVSDVMTSINSKYYDIVYKKGFYVHVEGTLTNKGTISMTARGSNAEGENVYLLKNLDGTFEYIPAVGADGAPDYRTTGDKGLVGNPGSNGLNRQTGGGGNGGIVYTTYKSSTNTGNGGSSGTSYSGGAGGGGGNHGVIAGATGTAGGNCYGVNSGNVCQTGVGITTGTVSGYGSIQANLGTGGLLIINTDTLNNIGTIESEGVSPAAITATSSTHGGASGGGSINIFATNVTKQGEISTLGGTGRIGYTNSTSRTNTSGNGGRGASTISILNENDNIVETDDTYDNTYLYSISSDYGTFDKEFDKKIMNIN